MITEMMIREKGDYDDNVDDDKGEKGDNDDKGSNKIEQ